MERYDAAQVAFRDAGADLVTAVTMNYAEEARVSPEPPPMEMPAIISITVADRRQAVIGQLGEAIAATTRPWSAATTWRNWRRSDALRFVEACGAWVDRVGGIVRTPRPGVTPSDAATEPRRRRRDLGARTAGVRRRDGRSPSSAAAAERIIATSRRCALLVLRFTERRRQASRSRRPGTHLPANRGTAPFA